MQMVRKLPIYNSYQSSTSRKDNNLERAKNIATIFSAIAIPIVLTIAGYFIQKQITNDSLKKDYVGIAAGILKEDPKNQEPELRTWAIKVLDDNSPVPFSKRAKAGLLTGIPIVLPGPAWYGPPSVCRTPSPKRTIVDKFHKLDKEITGASPEEAIKLLGLFADRVMKEEKDALITQVKLDCIQKWTDNEERNDIEYRKSIGAPSSKSVFEELDKKQPVPATTSNNSNNPK